MAARPKSVAKKPAKAPAKAPAKPAKTVARRAAPPPLAVAPKTRLFSSDVAIARADDALALLARDGVRVRVERRLGSGVIDHLASDRTQLDASRTSREVALTAQKSATGAAQDAAEEAGAWLSAVRRSARLRSAPSAVRKALSVGGEVSASHPAKLGPALQSALAALEDPATRALLGVLPDDVATGTALAARLATAGDAKASKSASRKSGTVDKKSAQTSLEAALREISAAGTLEFWHPGERELHDAFAALLHGATGEKHAAGASDGASGNAGAASASAKGAAAG